MTTMIRKFYRDGVPLSEAEALDERGIIRPGVSVRTALTLIDSAAVIADAATQSFASSAAGRAAVAHAERKHVLEQRYLGDRARPFSDAQAADAVAAAMTAASTPATIGDGSQLSHLQDARAAALAMRDERLRTAYLPTSTGGR